MPLLDNPIVSLAVKLNGIVTKLTDQFSHAFLLALRIYLAKIFVNSALAKISSWEGTLALFENEYKVPIVSPVFAAYSGTLAEFVLPILLLLGIASRPVAIAFFVFNGVALYSYLDGVGDAGKIQHYLWGTMILVMAFFGSGKISLDAFLAQKFGKK